ncbi:aspartate/glutamate racemase family protein [Kordiimonas sp. SCSIO 12610]|uniref:aspartate/glutamate racemase family protein n=1 Tax=Kordiimonas sp. SCSIO 12610 TaxID=2829597 RepID=UPI00210E47E7|nr:aspartate/glutamate racemase family protein [Kordiimonas sp. SCSIO 12610]UTW54003.1 aspartate/glutamate racemase family protein [Kordiimonas sp. SCSIO 12610]
MHIGLIGGIGPAATEFYYRGLVEAHKNTDHRMELTIVHAHTDILIGNMMRDNRTAQAEIFLTYLERLRNAGCDAAAITSMAGHFCVEETIAISPLPILNALPALKNALKTKDVRKVGLLGSLGVTKTNLYDSMPDMEFANVDEHTMEQVHSAYIEMAGQGFASDAHKDLFFKVGEDMHRNMGVEQIILAGTDLFLAFEGANPDFPVLDSAKVHIEALFQASVSGINN